MAPFEPVVTPPVAQGRARSSRTGTRIGKSTTGLQQLLRVGPLSAADQGPRANIRLHAMPLSGRSPTMPRCGCVFPPLAGLSGASVYPLLPPRCTRSARAAWPLGDSDRLSGSQPNTLVGNSARARSSWLQSPPQQRLSAARRVGNSSWTCEVRGFTDMSRSARRGAEHGCRATPTWCL